ncbi:MAG: DUF438 domain-containing protein [Acidobacteriota bacterium]
MSELSGKKEILKGLIKRLHEGARPEEIKEEFREVLKGVTPDEIARVEEELVKDGMPREEIQRLCEVHLAVFRESLEREKALAPAGHPVHTIMEEHKILLNFANELKCVAGEMKGAKDFDSVSDKMKQLNHITEHLKDSESHYVREENVLFPYLEKHGVTQPPAIMWTEHNKIREMKKNLYSLVDSHKEMAFKEFTRQLEESAVSLADMLSSHFYKENNVLFPTALKVITESEWKDIRHQFNELGYCCFTPEPPELVAEEKEVPMPKRGTEGMIPLETGTFSKEELETMLNTLPVDITFVDKEDTVRYFSQSRDRIFTRTKAVIGRKVQLCHPQQSVHVVNQLLEDFRSGRRDAAVFWINVEGKLIYIRYFAVRSQKGDYLGCVEVTQDITDIKKIKGEKRLL